MQLIFPHYVKENGIISTEDKDIKKVLVLDNFDNLNINYEKYDLKSYGYQTASYYPVDYDFSFENWSKLKNVNVKSLEEITTEFYKKYYQADFKPPKKGLEYPSVILQYNF